MEDHLKFWMIVAEYFQSRASEQTLKLYAKDTEQVPLESLQQAFGLYRTNPENTRMPLPSALIAALNLGSNTDGAADRLARNIMRCVRERGYIWSRTAESWPGDLIDEVGTFGVEVVSQFGAWDMLCEDANRSDSTAFHAQLRKTCFAVLQKSVGKQALPPGKILGQLVHGAFNYGSPSDPPDSEGPEKP